MKITTSVFATAVAAIALLIPNIALAHVTVKPAEAPVAKYTSFSVGVPVEKDMPTIAIRLIIPDGLASVSPNVKPGWTIETKKSGEGEDAKVSEIIWTGGTIPPGQRDEFLFTAKTPAAATTIVWKAYQTYADGSIVSWDAEGESEQENVGPASKTVIINDLAGDKNMDNHTGTDGKGMDRDSSGFMHGGFRDGNDGRNPGLGLSIIALGLSIYAVYKVRKPRV